MATIPAAPASCRARCLVAWLAPRQPAPDPASGGSRGTSKTRIGFVGLGSMGRSMAGRPGASGYEVAGHHPSADRAHQAAAAGVAPAAPPAEAAKAADVVLSSLPD